VRRFLDLVAAIATGRPRPIGRINGRPVYPIAGGSPAATAGKGGAPDVGGMIPFARASYKFAEKFFTDTVTTSASQQQQTPHNVTPGGFLRGVWIEISGASGVLGTAVVGSDFPFSLIATITLEDINGAPIIGPLTGYELFLLNKFGGYYYAGDPEISFGYNRTFATPFFHVWLPVEIRSDGLGSLANTDARAQYRVNYTVESQANFLSTGTVTTPITLTITGFVEYWAQVEAKALDGTPQVQVPPGLSQKVTQFAVHESYPAPNAALTQKHNRVGNLIRLWMYVFRTGAAATGAEQPNPRVQTSPDGLQDPIRIRLDNRYLRIESPNIRRATMARYYGLTGGLVANGGATPSVSVIPFGVYVYPRHNDLSGQPSPGDESNWLQTTEASFLQCESTLTNMGAASPTMTIITNDIAVAAAGIPLPAEIA
jgi:hypothetical protein